MKKTAFLSLFIFCAAFSIAQSPFLQISYKDALEKAKEQKKLLFVLVPSDKCLECNKAMEAAVTSNATMLKRISGEFIPVKISPDQEDFFSLTWLSEANEDGFGIFYVDGENNLIHSSRGPDNFIRELDFVKTKLKKILSVEAMEEKYFASDKKKPGELEKLILARSELGLDNYLLLNSYAQNLPKDSLNSVRVLRFLLRQAPEIESKADSVLKRSPRTQKAWDGLSFEDQNKYNQRVFAKSVNLAIRFRDVEYAERLAYYSAAQQDNDDARRDAAEQVFLNYFFSTGDTARFMLVAVNFFDRMMQKLPPVLFTKDWQKAVENSRMQVNAQGLVFIDSLRAPSFYAEKLARIALLFYHSDRENLHLANSLNWAKTAAELDPNQNTWMVYSLLLKKAGKEQDAAAAEKQATDEAKKNNLSIDDIMRILKNESKKTDN